MKDGKYLFMMLILLVCGITVSAQNKKSDREMFNEGYVLQSKDIHFAPPCEKYEPIMPRLYSIEKRRHEFPQRIGVGHAIAQVYERSRRPGDQPGNDIFRPFLLLAHKQHRNDRPQNTRR